MENNIKLFEHKTFGTVRVVMKDNEPWFVGSDVAKALGYADPSRAVVQHCKKSIKSTILANRQDGGITPPVNLSIIPESDVYCLIFRSNLPSAEKFQEWVFEEVLPSIRKTGMYHVTEKGIFVPNFDNPIEAAEAWLATKKENLAIQQKIAKAQNALGEAIAIAQYAEDHRHMLDDRRAATAMGRCGGYVKDRNVWKDRAEKAQCQCESLKDELGDSKNWKTVKAIPWLKFAFKKEALTGSESSKFYKALGFVLSRMSKELGKEKKQIEDTSFGKVNCYHIDVVNYAKQKLIDFCFKNPSVWSSNVIALSNPEYWEEED